jgi:hypothetical protein
MRKSVSCRTSLCACEFLLLKVLLFKDRTLPGESPLFFVITLATNMPRFRNAKYLGFQQIGGI